MLRFVMVVCVPCVVGLTFFSSLRSSSLFSPVGAAFSFFAGLATLSDGPSEASDSSSLAFLIGFLSFFCFSASAHVSAYHIGRFAAMDVLIFIASLFTLRFFSHWFFSVGSRSRRRSVGTNCSTVAR